MKDWEKHRDKHRQSWQANCNGQHWEHEQNPQYTYCISSNNSAIVLSYQWLPTSIQCGEAMARRRKEERRAGIASRGMVRRWGRFFSRVRPRVSQIASGGLSGATPRGQPWTSAVTLPPGRNGLIAWRMAVVSPLREPALCRHVPREFMRSAWLAVTPIIAATACHQSNDVETYSRSRGTEHLCRLIEPSSRHQ